MTKLEISVRCSTGTKFTVEADTGDTVEELKSKLVEGSSVPAQQQRLIYKGRILKDEQTIEHYGIEDGHTIHLVRGAASAAPSPAPSPAPAPAAAAPGGGLGGAADPFGLGGLGG